MAHETVPADIAAAITVLLSVTKWLGSINPSRTPETWAEHHRAADDASAALDAAILHHLRNADEMKAALERIE